MCIFCAETVKSCAAASEHIFYVEDCVAASGTILCSLRNVPLLMKRYQCATTSERKCAADIFCF